MTDPAQVPAERRAVVIPKPSAIWPVATLPRPALPDPALPDRALPDRALPDPALPEASRASARGALAAALAGVHLGCRDRQFLSRLAHWDKRSAASVASLIRRARLAGRSEATLTARQHEVVMLALRDAAVYRASGADAIGCWDCANCPGSQCADHARDADRARGYAALTLQLSGRSGEPGLRQLAEISDYRQRTPVAS